MNAFKYSIFGFDSYNVTDLTHVLHNNTNIMHLCNEIFIILFTGGSFPRNNNFDLYEC